MLDFASVPCRGSMSFYEQDDEHFKKRFRFRPLSGFYEFLWRSMDHRTGGKASFRPLSGFYEFLC